MVPKERPTHDKNAEINSRLLEDLLVVRLPKFIPSGDGLSIWWMGDDKITFQAMRERIATVKSEREPAKAALDGTAATIDPAKIEPLIPRFLGWPDCPIARFRRLLSEGPFFP